MPLRFRPARSRDFRSATRPRVAFASCRTNESGAAHTKGMATSFYVKRLCVNKLFEIFSFFGLQDLQRSSSILIPS
jgi:hypothetical protein